MMSACARTPWYVRAYRSLYWLPGDLRCLPRLRGLSEIIHFGELGIGDDLMCTAVLREMRRRGRFNVSMMSRWPQLFLNFEPEIRVLPYEIGMLHHYKRMGVSIHSLSYTLEQRPPDILMFERGHMIAAMCRSAGLSGSIDLRPYVYLSKAERLLGRCGQNIVVIQSTRASAAIKLANKEWSAKKFREVVAKLSDQYTFVQIGLPSDPGLDAAIDLRGRTTLREAAAILANALCFVGLEGFLMHLARSVDCRSVIVYGGYIHPKTSGYVCNENLFSELSCSPCGRMNSCEFDRECMQIITASDVIAAIKTVVAKQGQECELQSEPI